MVYFHINLLGIKNKILDKFRKKGSKMFYNSGAQPIILVSVAVNL